MDERAGGTLEETETLDARKVVRISPADLRFNIEKRSTQHSKRQVGIEEVTRVLQLQESGFIILPVQPLPRPSPPVSKPKLTFPRAEKPLEPVFTPANKAEEQTNTPRLPFEVTADPCAKGFIMNIDSEGTAPAVLQITRHDRGRSILRLPPENQPNMQEKEPEKPVLALSPQRKEEKTPIAAPTPSPRDCAESFEVESPTAVHVSVPAPYLQLENSLSAMILPQNAQEPVRKKRKKRPKKDLIVGKGPLVALSPQAGRLIQVREYVITHLDDHYSPTLPSLYSPDVHKAMSSFGSSSRRRQVFLRSNSPGDYIAFRRRQTDNWRTPESTGSFKHGATKVESRDPLNWSRVQLRRMSNRVL